MSSDNAPVPSPLSSPSPLRKVDIPPLRTRRNSEQHGPMCSECVNSKQVPEEIEFINAHIEENEKIEYTDFEGNKHVHDENIRVIGYKCSNGHEWTVSQSQNKCWCVGMNSGLSALSSNSYSPRRGYRNVRDSPSRRLRGSKSFIAGFKTYSGSSTPPLSESPQYTGILEHLDGLDSGRPLKRSPNRTMSTPH